MKNAYSFLLLCIIGLKLNAQATAVYDSVSTQAGNTDMVFYNLQSGQKTNVSNIDWHLAISVRPSLFPDNTLQGTTIRINEAMGVNVYQIPGFTADSFNVAVDTTGYRAWDHLHDSDTLLDLGALNSGLDIAHYNYGWGIYNGVPNHDVVGKKVYLFVLPDGSMKKFFVDQLDRDTAWDVKYANPDNSNLQTVHISKSAYSGKNLVYLNMLDNVVHDKEPLSANWDLQFLKYAATDVIPDSTFPAVGVWTNKGETTAEAAGYNIWSLIDAGGIPFVKNMSTIGRDWKDYDYQNQVYTVRDSLGYFVATNAGGVYKLIFTAYRGSGSGVVVFYKEEIVTGVAETGSGMALQIFPNPASSVLNIVTGSAYETTVNVSDLTGRLITGIKTTLPLIPLNTAEMESGVYLLSVTSGKETTTKKFVVAH